MSALSRCITTLARWYVMLMQGWSCCSNTFRCQPYWNLLTRAHATFKPFKGAFCTTNHSLMVIRRQCPSLRRVKTPNPAMESQDIYAEQRKASNELMKKECDNLLGEIDRLEKRRRTLKNRLKNLLDIVDSNQTKALIKVTDKV